MAGLGMASAGMQGLANDLSTSPEDLNPVVTPTTPEISVLGESSPPPAAREKPLLDFKGNPLGSIGAVLMNVADGAQGRPLFTEQLEERRALSKQQELKKLEVGVNGIAKGLELMKNAPPGMRETYAKQFGQLFENILPGFTETLIEGSKQPDTTMAEIAALGEHGKDLVLTAGSVEGARELATDPSYMKFKNQEADIRRGPEISEAFQAVTDLLAERQDGNEALRKAASDGWTLSDLQNPEMLKLFGLNKNHLATIARNPEIQSQLRPFGFIPSADLDEIAKTGITTKTPSQIAREQAAKTRASETEKIVAYQNPDTGEVMRRRQGDAAALKAEGFQPVVTGRTEQDARARVEQKREGEDSAPINGFISSALGLDPNTSVSEARDKGINLDVKDKDIRQLTTLEAGFNLANDTVQRAKMLVRNNPDVNTWGASLSATFGNLRANVTSVGKLLGADVADKVNEEFERADLGKIMDDQGVQASELRSLVLDLAYMAAVSRGQEGRGLSDNDVKRFSQIIGSSQADPDQFEAILDSVIVRFDKAYRENFKSTIRKDPGSQLPDVQAAESLMKRIEANEEVSAEDLQKLTPRARKEMRLMLESPG